MSTKPKIGWIGLGVMGSPMVCNLRRAGYEIFVSTRTKKRADEVLEAGAQWFEDIQDLVSEVDVLCTMVGYPKDVESVVLGEKGALASMKPDSLLIDFTTSSPELSEKIAQRSSAKGVLSLDAPVSGGDIGAKSGTLAIMCGGIGEAFTTAEPILQCLGDKIKHFGGAGSGQRVKMSNQILIASTMVGMVESMLYAERAGLNVSDVIELIGKGAAGCWSINNLGPRIVKKDWAPGFYIKHFLKDMRIALGDSKRMGLNLEGLALAQRFYSLADSHDWENDGTQALMKILRQINAS
tara:strand:+ start:60 stop:944 length:885 start_codon:yes stop_codon:yes gene_type:complete